MGFTSRKSGFKSVKKTKIYVYLNLVFGLIWLLAGLFKIGDKSQFDWMVYLWFILAFFYIGTFIYQIRKLKK